MPERHTLEELFEAYQKLAHNVADGFPIPGLTPEECRNEALIPLDKAVQSYDPSKGEFDHFARTVIQNHLKNAYNKAAKDCSREITMLDQAKGDSEETLAPKDAIEDVSPSPALEAERNDIREALKQGLLQLTPIQRRSLELFASGKNYAEIARERGVSLQAVRQAIESGKNQMRPFLVSHGIGCPKFMPSSRQKFDSVSLNDLHPEKVPKKSKVGFVAILIWGAFFLWLFWLIIKNLP